MAMIDQSFPVSYSRIYSDEIVKSLCNLLGFGELETIGSEKVKYEFLCTKWMTKAGVYVYSTKNAPFRWRVKEDNSILIKLYRNCVFPDNITDCFGSEIIVKDDEARDRIIAYVGKETRPPLLLEGLTSLKRKKTMCEESSSKYGVTKFILRIPILTKRIVGENTISEYVRGSTEIQIYTQTEVFAREMVSEATHEEFRKRQYLCKVFPVLFPKDIYEPFLRHSNVI
ncbi:MAG: hypothetical protein HZB65_01740 [Candidatus Aenigmarchaeota archaeon]|nr:hypothetical protein [Candidatus Aenigmarchaeota archaeon]